MRAMTHAILDSVTIPNAPILEIGVGGGAFASELARRYPTHRVIGTDLNPVALQHASRTPVHSVWQADLHNLPLPSNYCGAFVAMDVVDQKAVDLVGALRRRNGCWCRMAWSFCA